MSDCKIRTKDFISNREVDIFFDSDSIESLTVKHDCATVKHSGFAYHIYDKGVEFNIKLKSKSKFEIVLNERRSNKRRKTDA